MKYLFACRFASVSCRPLARRAAPAVAVLMVLAAGCGGAPGGENESPARDEAAASGSAAGAPGQQTTESPRLGPDGTPIRVERVTVGGIPVSVEIADTRALRERGLMNRDSLPADYGMLFVYPDELIRSFWMRNTVIPLDIAFFAADGTLERELRGGITARLEDGTLHIVRPDDTTASKSMHGLSRSLVQNMIIGVSEGFTKELQIQGVGYRATAKGSNALELALGYSHPVQIEAPEGIEFEVPVPTQIAVLGIEASPRRIRESSVSSHSLAAPAL